jgi:membrane protein insertase Oxa1/YidC/SpoIIIJ
VAENLSDTSPGFLLSRILTSPALFASIALWYLLTEIQFLTDFPFLLIELLLDANYIILLRIVNELVQYLQWLLVKVEEQCTLSKNHISINLAYM